MQQRRCFSQNSVRMKKGKPNSAVSTGIERSCPSREHLQRESSQQPGENGVTLGSVHMVATNATGMIQSENHS